MNFVKKSSEALRPKLSQVNTQPSEHLTRTVETLNTPHRPIRKICCIGAGYVVSFLRNSWIEVIGLDS